MGEPGLRHPSPGSKSWLRLGGCEGWEEESWLGARRKVKGVRSLLPGATVCCKPACPGSDSLPQMPRARWANVSRV